MRTHLALTDKSYIPIVEGARLFFRGCPVSITYEIRDIDVSTPEIYETSNSWSWLILKQTKSISSKYIYGLFPVSIQNTNDCLGIICDKEKALEDLTLLGQQSTLGAKQTIEVYVKGITKATDSLIHEIFHALSDHYKVEDDIHVHLTSKKSLEEYREVMMDRLCPDGLYPFVQAQLERLMIESPVKFRVVEGYRSPERQDEYYARKPKITNAKAWESMHQYRNAFDIFPLEKGYETSQKDWERIAKVAKSLGFDWGGDWTKLVDKPHFEMTFGNSLRKFQNGEIDWSKYMSVPSTSPQFARDLTMGSKGEDVRNLQKFLNSQGFQVAKSGPGSPGQETDYFGKLTRESLARYQEANNIKPSVGYFGPITKKHVNGNG